LQFDFADSTLNEVGPGALLAEIEVALHPKRGVALRTSRSYRHFAKNSKTMCFAAVCLGTLVDKEIKGFIDGAGESLRADRERAMLCVAYETLARRGEFVALEVRDIAFYPNGTGEALIRRGKTDAEGQVFRRLIGKAQIGRPLNPGSIAPIFKRVAQWIGMPERIIDRVRGHSTRVGATQDLAALDIDLAAITLGGGWKSTRMPLQYAEKINAARSGMARAAAAAGRDESVSEEG
jgi:hypothetical protein